MTSNSRSIFLVVSTILLINDIFSPCFHAFGKEFSGYTVQEKSALEKFRPLVADVLTKDYMRKDAYLVRWLRENDFNIQKAATGLKKHHTWRKENDVDDINNENLGAHAKYLPFRIEGVDKAGRPIAEVLWGKWDFRKYVLAGKRKDANRNWILILEKMLAKVQETSEQNGTDIDQTYMIGDLEGFSTRNHLCVACWPLIYDIIRTYDVYGTFVKYGALINAPRIFQPVFTVIQQTLSSNNLDRLTLFDSNKENWQRVLLNEIDPGQLPLRLGGTNKNFQ